VQVQTASGEVSHLPVVALTTVKSRPDVLNVFWSEAGTGRVRLVELAVTISLPGPTVFQLALVMSLWMSAARGRSLPTIHAAVQSGRPPAFETCGGLAVQTPDWHVAETAPATVQEPPWLPAAHTPCGLTGRHGSVQVCGVQPSGEL